MCSKRKSVRVAALTAAASFLCICAFFGCKSTEVQAKESSVFDFDNTGWNYNASDDVFWQIGIRYCEKPVSEEYETLGIFVPGKYFSAIQNNDGTYTVKFSEAKINGYTAQTAPIVMPVNTPGYSAQKAPAEYITGLGDYMSAGFIYVSAGCRGRFDLSFGKPPSSEPVKDITGSAPWAVTDLKAAVRYLRYNSGVIAGDTNKIITFGMSGGGAQSALMGITGNSGLYEPYLKAIGAAEYDKSGNHLNDDVFGAMAWCPVTSLDHANEAYEWNLGQYVTTGLREQGTFAKTLSDDLAKSYASYINRLWLKTPDGTRLSLEESESGIFLSGTYYDYMLATVERSLNNFLSDTEFPYTPDNSMQAGFAGNAGGNDGFSRGNTETVIYESASEYIAELNKEYDWIDYDAETNTAKIKRLDGFANICKKPNKPVGAFDGLERNIGENVVFGTDENEPLHFDSATAAVLSKNVERYSALYEADSETGNAGNKGRFASYAADFESDLGYVNAEGSNVFERVNMYNPMYFISETEAGYKTSKVAPHIRIRTGLFQGDTSLNVEMNMALALQLLGVDTDFETVWGLYHTVAERKGSATENFIKWVETITK